MHPFNWDTGQLGTAVILAIVTFLLGALLGPLLAPLVNRLGESLDERLRGIASRFHSRYRRYILEQFRFLAIKGVRTAAPVSVELDSVYVPLRGALRHVGLADDSESSQRIQFEEVLKSSKRVVVLGGPGTGKSTLLSFLAQVCAKKEARQRLGVKKELVPIYIILRDLNRDLSATGMPGLVDWLVETYKSRGLRPSARYFSRQLEKGNCLLLFDGLDEVGSTQARYSVTNWIRNIVALYPDNIFVLTSRPAGYELMPLDSGFCLFDLASFEQDQVGEFVTKWYLAVEVAVAADQSLELARAHALQSSEDLIETISEQADIERVATNPLVLSIITLVHRYKGRLSKRRVNLYNEFVDVLLGFWDEAKGLRGQLNLAQKRTVLQFLALTMHIDNCQSLGRQDAERVIGQALVQLGHKYERASDLLDQICSRSGLLVEQEINSYAFSHLTFQEYLAARQIAETRRENLRSLQGEVDQSALFSLYETGLNSLLNAMGKDHPRYPEALVYQQRLVENVTQSRRYGDTSARRAERTEIIDRLNELALSETGVSFNELCSAGLASTAQEPAERLLLRHVKDPWWQEVVSLYAAMGDATNVLLEFLPDGPSDLTSLLCAGKIAAEAARIDPEVRARLISSLDQIISEASTPKELLDLALVRSRIEDLDPAEFLCSLATKDHHLPRNAAKALGLYIGDLGSARLSTAIRATVSFGSEDDRWLDIVVAFGQIELTRLLGLPASVFRLIAGFFSERIEKLLSLVGNAREDLDMRYLGARALNLAMAEIPAGSFLMGNEDPRARVDEHPVHQVETNSYWIDMCPVTNMQYLLFLESTGHFAPPKWNEQWVKGSGARVPVVNVTFHDCLAYARWVGKRLLTEAEWEKAARGRDGRTWPWGPREDESLCNIAASHLGKPSPVGSYPENQSPYGLLDLAGNVWEHTSSLYRPYPYDPYDGREDLGAEGYRVLRGGSYQSEDLFAARTTIRNWDFPSFKDDWGFRCALSLK